MDRRNFGYTLIEVMIVLAVIGVLTLIALFGISAYKQGDAVSVAQREFLSNLRATQNKVDNGADGLSVWPVSLASYPLPAGVTMTNPLGAAVTVCFANRNLDSYDSTHLCGSCSVGQGFICNGGLIDTSAKLEVSFTNGSLTKKVVIEGSGMRINRVYEYTQ